MKCVCSYEGYVINGFRFHTRRRQRKRKTQNSGVVVEGETENGKKDFYGVLEEVIVLEYNPLKSRTSPKVVVFKCKWFDVYNEGRGIKRDKFGTTLVNVTRRLQTNEPFALATQIRQVFYVAAHHEPQWRVVIKMTPRNYFDFPSDDDVDNMPEVSWDNMEGDILNAMEVLQGDEDDIALVRDDVEPDLVDADLVNADVDDVNFIEDNNNEYEQEYVSDEDEAEFSDRESDIDPLDRDLEEDQSDSSSGHE